MIKRRTILWLIFLLTGLLPLSIHATTLAEQFHSANQAYFSGDLDLAKQNYSELFTQFPSGHLLYNLGNISYRQQHWGEALLYYEKALRLMPRDTDLRANTHLVRSKLDQMSDSNIFSSVIFFWNHFLTVNESLWMVGCVLGLFWIVAIFRKKVILIPLGVVALLFSVALILKYQNEVARHWAILVDPEIPVYSSFIETERPMMSLKDGMKVEIVSEQNFQDGKNWFQIRLPGSEGQGWIEAKHAGSI